MSVRKPSIGEQSAPRYEFRTFGQDLDRAHFRMGRLSVPVPEKVWVRHSEEIYIVSRNSDMHNAKVRDDKLDMKQLVERSGILEQWRPLMKAEAPFTAAFLRTEFFPALAVESPSIGRGSHDMESFQRLIHDHPHLQKVAVVKQRFGYMVNGTICEYAVVLVNGAKVVSIASESLDAEDVTRTIADVGLDGVENINYLQCIKRIVGMIERPLAN